MNGPLLVIAAHPDDEVLGCGGTMARASALGTDVYIAILGEGITSRSSSPDQADRQMVSQLHTCSHEVARLVGARDLFMYSLPDNRFDRVDLLDVIKIIEELITRLKPATVLMQHGGDLNIDHVITYRATMTATRALEGGTVRRVAAYPVASSTEWAYQKFSPPFRPNLFVDISETLETKIKAMQSYESEARPFPHPRSPEALRASAQHWGCACGLRAAEPFEIVRQIE